MITLVNDGVIETKNLILKKENILNSCPEEQATWLNQIGTVLSAWNGLEDFTMMVQSEILYHVWNAWENVNGISLSRQATVEWEHDFYRWARQFTKRRNREPSKISIDNKITVFRDWVAEEIIEHPETVFIPNREDDGSWDKEIKADDYYIEIAFEAEKCDYSKLLVARGAARRGEMTPDAWSVLADPYSTVDELKLILSKDDSYKKRELEEDKFRLIERNGIIYAKENGTELAIIQILFENNGNGLFAKAITQVLRSIGLNVPMSYRM